MKLYNCEAAGMNCILKGYFVANTNREAEEKFKLELEKKGAYHGSILASEVKIDGYEIAVKKFE